MSSVEICSATQLRCIYSTQEPMWRLYRTCDPQKLHFQSKLIPANLLTFANDVAELHATAREFSKFFKHRMQDLRTHGANATPEYDADR